MGIKLPTMLVLKGLSNATEGGFVLRDVHLSEKQRIISFLDKLHSTVSSQVIGPERMLGKFKVNFEADRLTGNQF